MLGPVVLFVVFAECTCNIFPDRNVFDTRELARLLIDLPVAFYNDYTNTKLILIA